MVVIRVDQGCDPTEIALTHLILLMTESRRSLIPNTVDHRSYGVGAGGAGVGGAGVGVVVAAGGGVGEAVHCPQVTGQDAFTES